jgi:hypothetical protein
MATLLENLRALGTGRVLDEVLAMVLDSAIEVTGAERGFIMLAREQLLEFKLARARGKVTLPGRTFETSLKISGPVHMRNFESGGSTYAGIRSAWTVPRSNGDTTVYLGYGVGTVAAWAGMVYRESGSNIPANDPALTWITRRMFPAGETNEARFNKLFGYVGSNTTAGGAPALKYTALTIKTDDDAGEVTKSSNVTTLAGRKLHHLEFNNICEGLRVSATVTANPQNDMAQEWIVLDGENFGDRDSGL